MSSVVTAAPEPSAEPLPAALSAWALAAFVVTLSTLLNYLPRWLGPDHGLIQSLPSAGQSWLRSLLVFAPCAYALQALLRHQAQRSTPGRSSGNTGLVAAVIGCALFCWLAQGLMELASGNRWETLRSYAGLAFAWFLSVNTFMAIALANAQRQSATTAAWHAEQQAQLEAQAELAQAQLQLLQAQNEPHFLFNALANVRRLLRTEPQAAKALLTDLLRYMQAALPALRELSSTLGGEAELVRAYLAVHQVRMGGRLQATVEVPTDLAAQQVPAMCLLTLVENALKHGLNPLVEGGSVQVRARRVDASGMAGNQAFLELEVADNGKGFGEANTGHGTGLANLRARLHQSQGPQAQLSLERNEPRGVIARVRLPLQDAGAQPS
jgi:two-component sensor histidine kinase